mgnify:CR=1 FL=1|tara:strand:- start:6495 stop:8393 length:1899 start_codon:yes stop_codon:yes gene_type:complete
MDQFQEFITTKNYCRWIEDKKRRETWQECVDRYYDYMIKRHPVLEEHEDVVSELRKATYDREVFPSMRALMTAGPAADVDDTCMYNCSYLAINTVSSFAEVLYILCCGTGVGFSCERSEIEQLPLVPPLTRDEDTVITVQDSRKGWADSLKDLMDNLYRGVHPTWDMSLVRPKGERLKTFGGRASGPEPLERLFKFIVNIFRNAEGRKLTSLNVHDIICMIGEIVIVGGVRRSALISLSDLDDRDMAMAKSGPWWENSSQRSLSNNSAVYNTFPGMSRFMEEWANMYNSHSGERGICNREAMSTLAAKSGRAPAEFGTNPCSEIILRPKQFCNLTEVVVRNYDTIATLRHKVRMAAILGTLQSACTKFAYLDHEWKNNCEEERLLGVSFTGIYDNVEMSTCSDELREGLRTLKQEVKDTNTKWAEILGINPSLATTCCKPSGTTSCVAGTSSGIHPRFSPYYMRRVRIDNKNPMCEFMIAQGFPHEPCTMRPDTTEIFSFPLKSPDGALTYENYSPIKHLDLWLLYQQEWCEHKPSVTVNYTDESILSIGQWVHDNWDMISGISFLPKDDHVYEQAPFEAIDEDTYSDMVESMPSHVDWSGLSLYELEDTSSSSHSLACHGGACEVVDILEN